jgi:restriction system protein
MDMPGASDLVNPVLEVLQSIGGAAPQRDIRTRLIDHMQLSEKLAEKQHGNDPSQTEIGHLVSSALQTLKYGGYIRMTEGALGGSVKWELIPGGLHGHIEEPRELYREYRRAVRKPKKHKDGLPGSESTEDLLDENDTPSIDDIEDDPNDDWKEALLTELIKLSSRGFEAFCQTLLYRLKFEDVRLTGGPNDGGIDGEATLIHSNVLSSKIYFQCKKYQETHPIGTKFIRDFRAGINRKPGGAPAAHGLFITTGRLTEGAKKEASEVHPVIDVIEGDKLIELMQELELGVQPSWIVDFAFFNQPTFEKDEQNLEA